MCKVPEPPPVLPRWHNRLIAGIAVLWLTAGCSVSPVIPYAPGQGTLTVTLSGFRNDQGVAIVSLFAGERGFPKEVAAAVATVTLPIHAGEAQAVFAGLPYGEYAVSVLHDEDGDGEMATGWLGTPREGFGFSGNPGYRFGHPDFAATSFPLIVPKGETAVVMRYETGRSQHQQEGRAAEAHRPQE